MHGTVPGADLKQGDGKENNLVYATFTVSVKHFVSKELFSISPVFTVVSRKGGNNAYAIFVCFFNSWVRASVPRVIAGTGICK